MTTSSTHDRQIIEILKDNEHFVLVYPNTPTGRMAARGAVRGWLLDCELDFDCKDAQMLCKAIDMNRFRLPFNRYSGGDARRRH